MDMHAYFQIVLCTVQLEEHAQIHGCTVRLEGYAQIYEQA